MSSVIQRNLPSMIPQPSIQTRGSRGSYLLWMCSVTLLSLLLTACLDHRPPPEEEPPAPRKPKPRPPYQNDPWFEKFLVETGGVGLHARLALSPGGRLGVAYWSSDGTEGEPCEDLMVDDPPLEVRWRLQFAEWSEETGWEVDEVARPLLLGNPPGLDLDYSRGGQPMISSIAGEAIPDLRYCGGGNLSLFTPSDDPDAEEWDVEYVAEQSNQAMSGEAASDFGFVVGYWPSLAQSDRGAQMIVYQDVHGGSLQRDDLARADLEVAIKTSPNGAWSYEVIDLAEGAGIFNQALITPQGDQLALYYISFDAQQAERARQGLWLARRNGDGMWERGLVFGGPTRGQPSLIPFGNGVAVAYYDPQSRRPVIAVLDDLSRVADSGAWRRVALGDLKYNEGHSPSLAQLPDGRLAVAWYRCGPAEVEECRPADDGVIFAYSERPVTGIDSAERPAEDEEGEDEAEGSNELATLADVAWKIEVVESGEEALCGIDPQLVIDKSQRAWVTWQCSRRSDSQGGFEYRLESARRDPWED